MKHFLNLLELALNLVFALFILVPFVVFFWFLLYTESYGSAAIFALPFWYVWRKSNNAPILNLRWEDRSFTPRADDD